jgi:hypothetical protein
LIGPIALASAVGAGALVLRRPDHLFAIACAFLIGLAFVWLLVSVFFPARPDRRCARCGEEAVRRLDPATSRGIACAACGHVEDDQSSFLLAEEEGPIEPIVLRERRLRGHRAAPEGPLKEPAKESANEALKESVKEPAVKEPVGARKERGTTP